MWRSACGIVVSLFLVTAVCGQSSRHQEGLRENRPDVFALTGATIVVEPGKVIEAATLVVRDGKIENVGADVAVPADARVIDLTGKTIYPGLIDGFAEQSLEQASPSAAYWNERVRPERMVSRELKSTESDRSNMRKQGVVAELLAPEGNIIKGNSAVVQTLDGAGNESILRARFAQHLRLTLARRRGERNEYPNSPMGAVALARQAMYDAQWYRDAWNVAHADPTVERPEYNAALADLESAIDGQKPVVIDAANELLALRADRFAREFGLKLILRGSGKEFRRLDAIRATNRAVLLPVNFPKPPNVATAESALDASLAELLEWDIAPENPARMHNAGITFALCSHGLSDRSDFLKSIRKAVNRGLEPEAALAALTTVPAKLFNIDDDLGTLERGKLASFVVTDGDLFAKKTKVLETWVSGKRHEFDPAKNRDATGEWSLTFAENDGKPKKLLLSITASDDKLKAKIRPDQTTPDFEKAVKLSRIGLKGVRASGTFPADEFGQKGVAQFTFVVEADDAKPSLGHIIWPDGSRATLSATRTSPADKPKDDKAAEESDDATDDDADDKKESDEVESKPASFAVNYPLGAFGRSEPAKPQHVVFRNATVWTCAKDGIRRKTSVLIGDGKILGIGGKIKVPEGTIEIDAKGRHLTPGIIDCHSHMGTDGGVNESGQAVTAEVRIGDFIDCNDITIYRHLAGGVTSSNILHGSANPIGGQNQVIKLRWGAIDEAMKFAEAPAGIKFALGENVKQSNWGDDYTTRYPQTRMGVEQIMRDEFEAAKEYVRARDLWKTTGKGLPPRRDLELDAIAEIIAGKRWIHCHSYRQDEILALIRVLDDYDITIGTFQHILEGYKVAKEMAEHGAMGSAFSDWWAYKFEVYDAIPYDGALMHNAGVVVSFNSDDRELARHLNQEAAKAVKYGGVSPAEALKFVTLNPAKQLRIDQYVGSIEVGKHADLALWSGPPLSNFSRCEQTWVDGRKYFDRAEDAVARKTVADMRTKLIQKILMSGESMKKPGDDDKKEDDSRLWPREDVFCFGNGLGNGHECVGRHQRQ